MRPAAPSLAPPGRRLLPDASPCPQGDSQSCLRAVEQSPPPLLLLLLLLVLLLQETTPGSMGDEEPKTHLFTREKRHESEADIQTQRGTSPGFAVFFLCLSSCPFLPWTTFPICTVRTRQHESELEVRFAQVCRKINAPICSVERINHFLSSFFFGRSPCPSPRLTTVSLCAMCVRVCVE